MRTLVVHTGALGDLILTIPALEVLASQGAVHVAGYVERGRLLEESGVIERAMDLDSIDFSSLFAAPSDKLKSIASHYDRAVVWMNDPDGVVEHGLRECGIPKVQCFPGVPREGWDKHASAYYLSCVGVDEARPSRLNVSPGQDDFDVVIHPGSGGRMKNWPIENFMRLGIQLSQIGRNVVFLRGPADEAITISDFFQVIEPASPMDAAQMLSATSRYVGNDSGITHLSAAVGCWTVAVFGPTDPEVWAPLGENVWVVKGEPWPSVEDVEERLLLF